MGHVNLRAFAQRLLRGSCACAVLGDSINVDTGLTWTSMKVGYIKQLKPTTWAGDITSATTAGQSVEVTNYPTPTDIVGLQASFGGTAILDGDGGAVTGEADRWPCLWANWRFPTASGNVAWGATMSRWNFSAARRALYQGGDWMTGATTCRVLFNRGSVGVSNVGYYSTRGGASFQSNDNAALASGFTNVDIPIAAGAGDTVCEIYGSNAGNDERAQNLYVPAMRHKVDGATGLTLGCFGIGGAGVADLNSTTLITQAARNAMVAAFEIDTYIIAIGTNDTTWGATQYTHLLGIIDKYRTASTAAGKVAKFLLVSPYPQSVRAYPDVQAYMAQACGSASDISFFDLAGLVGTYAQILAAGYLAADNVHPSATGAVYFATLLNSALEASLLPASVLNTLSSSTILARHSNWKRKALTRHTRR